jgi:ferritin-like metal-binding protein YciE
MPIQTLRDLYIAELRDLYDVEQHVLQALPAISAKATSAELRRLLDTHVSETRIHVQRLEMLFGEHGITTDNPSSDAIDGLIAETHRRLAHARPGPVLDSAIIAAVQRIEHYEMAAYGCARSYADALDDVQGMRVLQQTLNEEGDLDHRLTQLAEQELTRAAVRHDDNRRTGVWMTQGLRPDAAPARDAFAESGLRDAPSDDPAQELMIARGERDSGEIEPRETERPKTTAPRIERYRDR